MSRHASGTAYVLTRPSLPPNITIEMSNICINVHTYIRHYITTCFISQIKIQYVLIFIHCNSSAIQCLCLLNNAGNRTEKAVPRGYPRHILPRGTRFDYPLTIIIVFFAYRCVMPLRAPRSLSLITAGSFAGSSRFVSYPRRLATIL